MKNAHDPGYPFWFRNCSNRIERHLAQGKIMRRLVYFLSLVLVVSASATCVNASTDCERWFASYRRDLVHSQQVKRIEAARRRARLYARRKLAGYVKPKPKPAPLLFPVVHHPTMNPREARRRVDLACGVLPESSEGQPLISEEQPAEFTADVLPPDELALLPGFDSPGTLLPQDNTPAAPVFSSEAPPSFSGGGVPVYIPPFTTPVGTAPGSSNGGGTIPPVGTPPGGGSPVGTSPVDTAPVDTPPVVIPPPVLAPVPEPGSILFMLTGLAGAAGVVRRRFAA